MFDYMGECLSAASRRPGSVEETDACFIVRDANGQALAYVYFEEEPGRPSGGLNWPFRPRRRRYAGSRDVSDDIPDKSPAHRRGRLPRYLREQSPERGIRCLGTGT